jgi:hypothetical protein
VRLVLSGHECASSVQAERSERRSLPLLIRGFGVQVPGGAPARPDLRRCPLWSSALILCGAGLGPTWAPGSVIRVDGRFWYLWLAQRAMFQPGRAAAVGVCGLASFRRRVTRIALPGEPDR